MGQDWQPHGQPHQRSEQPLERVERTERNPFAAPGPIWAKPGLPARKSKRSTGKLRFPHTLVTLGLLGLIAGILLPWAAPARYGTPVDLIRHGMLLGLLQDGLYIFHIDVDYVNVVALSLAGALLVCFLLLMALNRAMNIPVLTGWAWLLIALIALALALGLLFLFARQQVLSAPQSAEPAALGVYVWFGGLGLLVLGLAAEYIGHLRLAGPAGPSGLGRVL
ncbi:MAG TPA: hypothetical protein VF099_08680 [Ktedonobacterales bacterium]